MGHGDVEPNERGRQPHAAPDPAPPRLITQTLAVVVRRAGIDEGADADAPEIQGRSERDDGFHGRRCEVVCRLRSCGEPAQVRHPTEQRFERRRQWSVACDPKAANGEDRAAVQRHVSTGIHFGAVCARDVLPGSAPVDGVARQHGIDPRVEREIGADVAERIGCIEK